MSKLTPSEIRAAHDGFFFSRDTMKFFGDTMKSFGTTESWSVDGADDGPVTILYRRPSATVNVFGKRRKAGREYFNAWRFDPETGGLRTLNKEDTALIYAVMQSA